jgi:vanillate O-demethylase ferredoxin subunit
MTGPPVPPHHTALVAARTALCEGVVGLDLVPAESAASWPPAPPGSHVDVMLPNGLVRQYSVHAPTPDGRGYRIAVQREVQGRGGSAWIHDHLEAGATVVISEPRNAFPLVDALRYRFVAGGIGITPILPMLRAAIERGVPATLDYCTRNASRTAFHAELQAPPLAPAVRFVHDGGDPAAGLDVRAAVGPFDGETALYCCGPNGLMAAVADAARASGWPEAHLHFEHFKRTEPAAIGGSRAFRIRIASSGEVFEVRPDQTVLEVLRENDYYLDSSCEQGLCGTCRVGVLEGVVDHRDEFLGAAERAENSAMTTCCSRALSDELVLDL